MPLFELDLPSRPVYLTFLFRRLLGAPTVFLSRVLQKEALLFVVQIWGSWEKLSENRIQRGSVLRCCSEPARFFVASFEWLLGAVLNTHAAQKVRVSACVSVLQFASRTSPWFRPQRKKPLRSLLAKVAKWGGPDRLIVTRGRLGCKVSPPPRREPCHDWIRLHVGTHDLYNCESEHRGAVSVHTAAGTVSLVQSGLGCHSPSWQLWGFSVLTTFGLMFLYPSVIAPLFNKFEPLKDEELKTKIEALVSTHNYGGPYGNLGTVMDHLPTH